MQVFFSWSGATSLTVAKILHENLRHAFQGAEFWIASRDVRAGDDWWARLTDALHESRVGVVCLTRENALSPWILFESGVLARAFGQGRLIPYLIDVSPSDVAGPLAHLQHVRSDEEGTRELFRALNEASDARRSDEDVASAFEIFWPRIRDRLIAAQRASPIQPPRRSERELLEEILDLLRGDRMSREILRGELLGERVPLTMRYRDYAWRPADFIGLSAEQIEEFFARELWPEAKERGYRNWEGVFAKDPLKNARLNAIELAEKRAAELGLRDHWDRWFAAMRPL